MSLQIAKSVNFGSRKGSLSTVGYRLLNSDGSTKLARTTSGITELIVSTGLYGGNIEFDDGFSGFIVWDTGQATPLYAMEQYDERLFASGGGVAISTGLIKEKIWTKEEKDKVLKQLSKIAKRLNIEDTIKAVSESIKSSQEILSAAMNNINHELLKHSTASHEKTNITEVELAAIKENIETLGKALEILLEYKEFEGIIKEVDDHVKIGNASIEG